jgi:hypothetical protein
MTPVIIHLLDNLVNLMRSDVLVGGEAGLFSRAYKHVASPTRETVVAVLLAKRRFKHIT